MDLLTGLDLENYVQGALHLSRRPTNVLTADGPLFEEISSRNNQLIGEFHRRRSASQRERLSSFGGAAGGDVFAAIPRFYSPLEYWEQTQIPWNISDDKHRFEMYKWFDLFYRTHFLIPILVDIFTRFPLVGMELDSPDQKLTDFYEGLFFDKLDYEHFFVDMGREYWTLGQSFPLGHFNEMLGVWDEEELIDPTLVQIKKWPIIGTEQFFLMPPPDLVAVVEKGEPKDLYWELKNFHPEIMPFLKARKPIPVSDIMMRQVAFKVSPRDRHGTPLLLRLLRTLMHEEKLMASQDAIAERLYSPLILVKLGVQDMGPNRGPWIPGPEHVAALRNDLDVALSSDFRLLVHHFGIEVQNVFGREQMPRLDQDFDRIERRLMNGFGINPSLLSGGAASQPYASSALQAEFLSQMLRTYQHFLKLHYEARAKIVAEAQGHYAYEKRGNMRIPIVEEVLETDPETGEQTVVKRKKLMIPELRMKVLDLRDEATQRNFLQALKQQGVPIADQNIAMGMHYRFKEELDEVLNETIQKTVAQQEAKVQSYNILVARGLPIPPDLKAEIEGAAGFQAPQPGQDLGQLGVQAPEPGDSISMPPPPDMGEGAPPGAEAITGPAGERPEISDQRSPLTPSGPEIPGVPGMPNSLGIPGGAEPAIKPSGPGRGANVISKFSAGFDDLEESNEVILEELPYNRTKLSFETVLTTSEESAIIPETESESESAQSDDLN